MARSVRHPLRRKAVVVGLIESVKNAALVLGVDGGVVDATSAVALATVTLLVELGVLVNRSERDVTPVLDARLPDGHEEEAL